MEEGDLGYLVVKYFVVFNVVLITTCPFADDIAVYVEGRASIRELFYGTLVFEPMRKI